MTDNEQINELREWYKSQPKQDPNNSACYLTKDQYEYIEKELNKMKPQKKYTSLADLKNELPVDAKEIPEMQNMYLLTNDIAKMLIAEYKIEAITSRRGKAGVERKVYYEKK